MGRVFVCVCGGGVSEMLHTNSPAASPTPSLLFFPRQILVISSLALTEGHVKGTQASGDTAVFVILILEATSAKQLPHVSGPDDSQHIYTRVNLG